jgi:hypothetical protein
MIKYDSLPNPSAKPDVYYLVFDCYPGTIFLKEYMNYDNSSFNEELEKKGFHVIKDPKSNYNRTAFSLASSLNFEYLKDIVDNTKITPNIITGPNLQLNTRQLQRSSSIIITNFLIYPFLILTVLLLYEEKIFY